MAEGQEERLPEEIAEIEKERIPDPEKAEAMAYAAKSSMDQVADNLRQVALLREIGLEDKAKELETGAADKHASAERQMEFAGDIHDYERMSRKKLRSLQTQMAAELTAIGNDLRLLDRVREEIKTDEQEQRYYAKRNELQERAAEVGGRLERILHILEETEEA